MCADFMKYLTDEAHFAPRTEARELQDEVFSGFDRRAEGGGAIGSRPTSPL